MGVNDEILTQQLSQEFLAFEEAPYLNAQNSSGDLQSVNPASYIPHQKMLVPDKHQLNYLNPLLGNLKLNLENPLPMTSISQIGHWPGQGAE